METSSLNKLPQDPLFLIFSSLPLRQIVICRSVCKSLNATLSSPSFLSLFSNTLPLLALRNSHHQFHNPPNSCPHTLNRSSDIFAYDPFESRWLTFPLDFLPFRSPHPVAASGGLVFLWAESFSHGSSFKPLIVCNPVTRMYRVLPQLGSAWSRHGSVLVDSGKGVIVLTELAALFLPKSPPTGNPSWLNFSSNLPSKPRSPVLVEDSVFAICDVGSPWRSQWKLFSCSLSRLENKASFNSKDFLFSNRTCWVSLERKEWGDVMDIMKRPRLVRGSGNSLLMIGGLKSTFTLSPICSTILMLKLRLEKMEWEEAGRMPLEMYRVFAECNKLKVFGGGNLVCFSAKRLGKMALWDESKDVDTWRWVDEVAGGVEDGLVRGFVYEAKLSALP